MASVTLNKIRGEFEQRGLRGVVTSAFERPGRWVRAYRELNKHQSFDQSAEVLSYARTLGSGWFNPGQVDSEICALLDQVRGLRPRVVLEIGTMNGGTLFLFTRVAAPDAMLISIDLPGGAFGGGYPQWRSPLYRRFALPGQSVHLVRGDSQGKDTIDRLQRILGLRSIDFLFIDGDHSYEGVKKDHQTYGKFVRRGGIIAFDDVAAHSDRECEVSRYWNELAVERSSFETLIESPDQGWGDRAVLCRMRHCVVLAAIDLRLADVFRRLPKDWRDFVEQAYVRLLSFGVGEVRDPAITADETEATRQLSVIVPVHNAPIDTERCLQSLERFGGEAEIILVDDGSTDLRASGIVADFATRKNWKARRNEKGSFHSGACMSGARLATRPILFLLNSDTVATQHSWELPVSALLRDASLKAVGPRTSDGWGSQSDFRARRCRYVWSDAQVFWYAERLHRRYGDQRARQIKPFVTGAALFVRRQDWDRIGGFSDCREHIGNDVDLRLKLTADGGWIGVCDGAYVHHLGGRSAGGS